MSERIIYGERVDNGEQFSGDIAKICPKTNKVFVGKTEWQEVKEIKNITLREQEVLNDRV